MKGDKSTMTEVYMPWEAILKIGMNGVNSSDDEMEIITNYTSVDRKSTRLNSSHS